MKVRFFIYFFACIYSVFSCMKSTNITEKKTISNDTIYLDYKSLNSKKNILVFDSLYISYKKNKESDFFFRFMARPTYEINENTVINDYYTFMINEEYNLKHLVNKVSMEKGDLYYSEYIEILSSRFNLDSLFANDIGAYKIKSVYLRFDRMYKIEYSKKIFILLEGHYRFPLTNFYPFYRILFDITNVKNIQCFTFLDNYNHETDCFSDFNSDGKLDYLYLKPYAYKDLVDNINYKKIYYKDSIDFYSFTKETGFIKDKNYYIMITFFPCSKPAPFIVDLENSKWFFDLKTTVRRRVQD